MAISKNFNSCAHGLSRRRCLALLAALPGLAWLPGCSAFGTEPLRIAAHGWLGYAPLFLARDLDYLPKNDVHLMESLSAGDSMELLRGNVVHGAGLTLDETLRLRDEGLDLRIVLIFNQSLGADVLLARGNIHTLRDLAGRRLGAETNAVGMLIVDTVLKAAGLAPDQVTLVSIGADGHEAAWRSGALDALVTYEPIVSRILNSGGAHRLFDSRQMPDTIFDVLVVRADSLSRHERHLKQLLRGYFQGRRLLRDNPIDASYRLTNFLRIDPDAIIAAYRYLELPDAVINRRYLSPGSASLIPAAERLARWMTDTGLLHRPPRLDNLLSAAYLPRESGL